MSMLRHRKIQLICQSMLRRHIRTVSPCSRLEEHLRCQQFANVTLRCSFEASNNRMSSIGGPRRLSSSLVAQNDTLHTRTYNFGSVEVTDFSKLSARQSAELEDELLSSLRKSNNTDDNRLLDPVLGTVVTKKGLDWIRSISIPSSLSFEHNIPQDYIGKSIVTNLQPPTLLHPQLHTLASNLASFVQEEVASLISTPQKSQWPAWKERPNPKDIPVEIRIQPQSTRQQSAPSLKTSQTTLPSLQNVKHFLAVYSCKGGVGKSTIAANLAYQLASSGGRIGLLDLDVYGPSLPLLVKPSDPTVRKSPLGEGIVEPIEHKGVKLMSLGYVSPNSGVPGSGPNSGAAVLRGPMAGRVVSQLLKGTNWGELDVLILDLPPGTGDVQLEVCQSLSLSGAIAVSTPSNLAWADVLKGVQMFGELGVVTLGLVENMAYFVCEGGGRHYPFGKSHSLSEDDGGSASTSRFLPNSSHVFYLPISTTVNASNDSGSPLCCDRPDGAEDELEAFSQLADAVAVDLMLIQHRLPPLSVQTQNASGNGILTVILDEAGKLQFDVPLTQMSVDNQKKSFTVRLFSNDGGYQKSINGGDLRYRDPKTGDIDESLINITAMGNVHHGCGGSHSSKSTPSMVQHHSTCNHDYAEKDSLFPATLTRKGNYGYEVAWADGAKVIYSLLAIAKAAGAYARSE